jgi:hypothetical protein
MWFILSCLLLCGVAVVSGRRFDSSRAALWGTWTVAVWFLQIWIAKPFGSMVIDLRLVAVLLGILGIVLHFGKPREEGSVRLLPAVSDFVLIALFACIVISQQSVGRLRPLGPAELARKWVFPYIAGRLFIGSNKDLRRVAPLMSSAIIVVCSMAMVEALTKVNLPNKLLGRRYGVLEAGEGYRWGMKRAQGSMDHPIFFGMALVMSMPWALHGMEIAKRTGTRKWMRLGPWALAMGLFATVSRGPQICSLGPVGTYFYFRKPKLRVPIIACGIVGGLFLYGARDQLLGILGKWAGEKQEVVTLIEINGEEYEYTGTMHRILLWKVYREAIERLPKFGYGLELRGVPLDEANAQRFGSIDSHYLMFMLQHGYYAVGLFVILGLLGLINSAYVALKRGHPAATLAAGLFGSTLAVMGNLGSVWFPPDFGGVWLFGIGLAASLARLPNPTPEPLATEANERRSPIETEAMPQQDDSPKPLVARTPMRPDRHLNVEPEQRSPSSPSSQDISHEQRPPARTGFRIVAEPQAPRDLTGQG